MKKEGAHMQIKTTAARASSLFGASIRNYDLTYSNGRVETQTRVEKKPVLPLAVGKAVQLITGLGID